VAQDGLREFETEDGPPPTGLFVTLATYEYYAQNFGAAEKARQKALKIAGDEANRKEVNRTLDQIEEDARKVGKQIEQAKKQARKNKGQSVEQPFGNLGTQATTGTTGVQP
jgi:predicted phage-related endonuclease